MKQKGLVVLGFLILWPSAALYACDLSESLNINGFGTVGVSTNDSDEIRYRVRPEQEDSIGDDEFNLGINTILGLQGRYAITDALSVTAQGIVRYVGKSSWKGDLEWAYLNYDSPWDISVRAGKFRLPIFQSTELAYVGYSRLYVRPPIVFYGVGGYEHVLGAQVNYNSLLGEIELGLRATFGSSDNETPPLPNGNYNEVESNDIKIFSAKIGNDDFWFNIAYTDLTSDITRFETGRPSRYLGTTGVGMWSAEGQIRFGGFVLDGGYGKGSVDRLQPDEEVRYLSLSYPYATFTPFLLYSSKQFSGFPDPPPPLPGNPPPPPVPDESDSLDEVYSLGVRYDVQPGLAVKFQWDHIKAASRGGLSENLTGERGTHNAFSLVLDWMF